MSVQYNLILLPKPREQIHLIRSLQLWCQLDGRIEMNVVGLLRPFEQHSFLEPCRLGSKYFDMNNLQSLDEIYRQNDISIILQSKLHGYSIPMYIYHLHGDAIVFMHYNYRLWNTSGLTATVLDNVQLQFAQSIGASYCIGTIDAGYDTIHEALQKTETSYQLSFPSKSLRMAHHWFAWFDVVSQLDSPIFPAQAFVKRPSPLAGYHRYHLL
jgi:hypothetical protein